MRVCLFSKFGQSSNLLYSGTREGLDENKIEYIDINVSKERNRQSPHWISIPSLTPTHQKSEDTAILQKISDFKPHVILLLQYDGIAFLVDNGKIVRSIIGMKGIIAFWYVDLAQTIDENRVLGTYIDYLFLSNEGQLEEYETKWGIKNAVFMPQGCFVTHTFKAKRQYKNDVVFLGRRQQQDPRYHERNVLLDSFRDSVGLTEFDNEVNLQNTIALYQESKIVLGSSWRNDIRLYSSDRIFNVLGAGGFYLCSYFPGIETLFHNHKHLVWFKTSEEGLKFAKYYLQNNEEREKIAYNGYMLVKEKHTYKERIRNILDVFSNKTYQFFGYVDS